MRFHGGLAVGHPFQTMSLTDSLPHSTDLGVPMDIDTPDDVGAALLSGSGFSTEEDSSSDSTDEGSDDSGDHIPEADSGEELDIYE